MNASRALIWAGINAYGNESITLEQAGDLCENFSQEKGVKAFGLEIDRILSCGMWLNEKGGTDTGNPKPAQKKPLRNTSKTVSTLLTESVDSPPASSGIQPL